jgi:Helix-turn-helix of DDE superfamily endonuclease
MGLRYDEVKDDATKLRACTGLDRAEFEQLLPTFTLAWDEHRRTHHRAPESRKRAVGGGRKSRLASVEARLFFILFYFKTYPLQTVMGTIFGMSQSQVNEWVHRLSQVLQATLDADHYLPARDPATLAEVLAECPSLEFVIDGTERPTQRPSNDTLQRQAYSGKKRRTHIKTLWSSI